MLDLLLKTFGTLAAKTLGILATPLDGSHDLYWLFILTFLGLAAYAHRHYYAIRGRFSLREFLGFVFPKDVYLHPSALVDYQIFIANRFVAIISHLFLVVAVALVSSKMENAVEALLGKSAAPWEPGGSGVAIVTLVAAMSSDFSLFFVHMLSHRIPLLWEIHRVHHSAEVLTPVSAFRHHPLYDLFTSTMSAFLNGVLQGVVLYFFVGKVPPVTLFGANLVLSSFRLLGVNLRHSHIWLSWGPVLSRIFVSPAQHQIHHSVDEKHLNKNYGEIFALWDWMFGSLYVPREKETLIFGVARGVPQEHPTLFAAYFFPLRNIGLMVARRIKSVFSFADSSG